MKRSENFVTPNERHSLLRTKKKKKRYNKMNVREIETVKNEFNNLSCEKKPVQAHSCVKRIACYVPYFDPEKCKFYFVHFFSSAHQ